jgi:tetratricopeptide (TPR) repeat protein
VKSGSAGQLRLSAWLALCAAVLLAAGCASEPPAPAPKPAAGAPGEATPDAAVAPPVIEVPERAAQQFAAALALVQAGKLTDAELEFQQLALAYPQFAGPQVNLALIYERSGRLDEAERALKDAITRDPGHALAQTELGVVYRKLGRFKDAEAAYQAAIAAAPDYAPAYLNLGVLLDLYLREPQRALQAFQQYQLLSGNGDKRVANWIAELQSRLGSNPQSKTTEPQQ